jgi:3'(2'), 5'-bisphosphate nucleotidase
MLDETKVFVDKIKIKKAKELVSIGSVLRTCLIAEGEADADIYPRLGPTMEWDTAAAHAIVNESDHHLREIEKGEYLIYKYNKENLLNSWFVVVR